MARGRFAGRYGVAGLEELERLARAAVRPAGAAPPDGPLAVAKTRLRLERLAARPAVAVSCWPAAQCGMMATGTDDETLGLTDAPA